MFDCSNFLRIFNQVISQLYRSSPNFLISSLRRVAEIVTFGYFREPLVTTQLLLKQIATSQPIPVRCMKLHRLLEYLLIERPKSLESSME